MTMLRGDEQDDREGGSDMGRVGILLDELRDADPPPAELVRRVMSTIESTRHRGELPRDGGMRMARKVLIGLAAAAAIVMAVLARNGWPPAEPGTEGAIGAAKRHQAQQMSAADVKLADQGAQEFLQSDLGARLLKDPQARSLLGNAGVREALANNQVREALASAQVRDALSNAQVREAMSSA